MPREHEDLRLLVEMMEPFAPNTLVVTQQVAMQIVGIRHQATFKKHYPTLANMRQINKVALARAMTK